MNCRFVALLALGFVTLADTPAQAQPGRGRRGEQDAGQHGWIFGLADGKAQAQRSGKPLMVVVRCVP